MDKKELHLEHVNICYKLYDFIMKILSAQASKTVTLGRSSNYGSSSLGVPISDKMVRHVTPCIGLNSNELRKSQYFFRDNRLSPQTEHVEEENNLCRNIVDEELCHQASKKMVSINDKAEEIILTSTKKRNKVLP